MRVSARRGYKLIYLLFFSLAVALLLASTGCGGTASSPPSQKTLTAIAASPATANLLVGATEQFSATGTFSDGSSQDVTASAIWTDASGKVAKITSSGVATALAAGSTTITATMGGLSGSASITVSAPAKTLTAIAVTPATASILAGATQQFTATATYSDSSTADVSSSAAWTSSNAATAKINPAGLASALAAGSATITAVLNGVTGSATLAVSAAPKTLSSVTVTPATASIAQQSTQQFTATAAYSDGSKGDVTSSVTWTGSNPAAATVNAAGLATGVAVGSATITATLGGIHGTAALTVTPSISSISVTPNQPSIAFGATQQFTATATYSDASTKDITATATWQSSNTAFATINAAGLATAASAGSITITASLNGVSGNTTLAVTGITSISVTPASPSFAVGSTQQFTATATFSDNSTADITSTATWKSSNTGVASIAAGGLATGVASGSTTVTASLEGKTGNVTASVTIPAGTGVNVPTWHYDNGRSGLNPNETTLTPANVAPKSFGKLFSYLVDGYAYAEPLLMSNITINGVAHNVLYIATENDSVYAFDADTYGTGKPLWQTSVLKSGEAPISGTVKPVQGITSTPVIDPSTNTIYVVSAQKPSAGGATYRLSALDITTGAQKHSPVTITASVSGTNSTAVNGKVFLPSGCVQRAALLLSQGTLYIGVGSCHSGWLLSYDAQTLTQTGVFNASPNIDGEGTYGGAGGIWMGSGGPVADSAGNVYVSTGNGPWDPSQGSYGDSILKFSPTLQLLDYFTPQEYDYMNCEDSDLAAGGLMMIPGSGQIVGGGKMGKLYLVNTSNLGQEKPNDTGAAQSIFVEQGVIGPYSSSCTDSRPAPNTIHTASINSYEIFGTAAYYNGSIYIGVTPTSTTPTGVRHLQYSAGHLTGQEYASPSIQQNTRGTTPFISANGNADGILWMIDEGQPLGATSPTAATLRAYDAGNLSNELYSSPSSDQLGYGIKFSSPIVANGKVYISTGHDLTTATNPQGEIDVYGLK
jgi:uncharacterized protein YjdB